MFENISEQIVCWQPKSCWAVVSKALSRITIICNKTRCYTNNMYSVTYQTSKSCKIVLGGKYLTWTNGRALHTFMLFMSRLAGSGQPWPCNGHKRPWVATCCQTSTQECGFPLDGVHYEWRACGLKHTARLLGVAQGNHQVMKNWSNEEDNCVGTAWNRLGASFGVWLHSDAIISLCLAALLLFYIGNAKINVFPSKRRSNRCISWGLTSWNKTGIPDCKLVNNASTLLFRAFRVRFV